MFEKSSLERDLATLFNSCQEHAIIFLDLKGNITRWIAGANTIFGYTEDEILGKPVSILFTPEDVERGIPTLEREIASRGTEAEDDRWMMRKDGVRFWATGVLCPLYEQGKKIFGFGKILRNRTDLKGQLETLKSQVLSELKASERKNVFIGTLAHELRNPVSSALNALTLLEKHGVVNNECMFARSVIRRQMDYIVRMIEDLLEVTRIGAGKITLHPRRMDLAEIISRSVESCRSLIDAKTHDFNVITLKSSLLIDCDPERLQQVFVNLIQNAFKFTPPGGGIWVKVDREESNAVVKVEDSGIGISSEMLPRIFDLFSQAENEQDKNKGLGIGLSVVKDLVSLHGGSVLVRSDGIGKGSQFTVRLPMAGSNGGGGAKAN
jgi:PAS domain S-box-containing protein